MFGSYSSFQADAESSGILACHQGSGMIVTEDAIPGIFRGAPGPLAQHGGASSHLILPTMLRGLLSCFIDEGEAQRD